MGQLWIFSILKKPNGQGWPQDLILRTVILQTKGADSDLFKGPSPIPVHLSTKELVGAGPSPPAGEQALSCRPISSENPARETEDVNYLLSAQLLQLF